jgi:hypothetical protein
MLKAKTLFCLILFCASAKAQKNISPAILITTHNDTLKVWVANKENSVNARSVRIRRDSLGNKFETWPAAAVRSIAVADGPYYIGAAVLIDRTTPNIEVSKGLDSSYLSLKQDTLFLTGEFISGKICLYSFTDENKSHYFVQKPGGPVTELFDRKYRLVKDEGTFDAEDRNYIHQLQELMEDCPNLSYNLLDVPYTVDALKRTAQAYNNGCGKKGKTLYKSETREGRLEIALLAGTGYSGISVNSSSVGNPLDVSNPIKSQYAFTGGIGFDYFLSKTAKKFSIVGMILYQRTQASESQYTEYGSPTAYTRTSLAIDYSSLHVDLLCRYSFPLKGPLLPFINGGLTFFDNISNRNNGSIDEFYDNAHHVTNADPFQGGFKNFQEGLEGGAGLRYKRMGLEYKYETLTDLGSYSFTKVHVNCQQVLLSFTLK